MIALRFDGELLHLAAQHAARVEGRTGERGARLILVSRRPSGRELSTGRAILERTLALHIPDVEADHRAFDQEAARRVKGNAILA